MSCSQSKLCVVQSRQGWKASFLTEILHLACSMFLQSFHTSGADTGQSPCTVLNTLICVPMSKLACNPEPPPACACPAGLVFFVCNLVTAGWIKFLPNRAAPACVTGILALALIYIMVAQGRWVKHIFGRPPAFEVHISSRDCHAVQHLSMVRCQMVCTTSLVLHKQQIFGMGR